MIRFLVKGLIRDRHRSLFPVLMVATGVFLTVVMYSWVKGAMGDFVDSNARFEAGHVKIITTAYKKLIDQTPNDLAILGVDDLLRQMRGRERDMIWTPRIRFGGLLDIPDAEGETRSQGPVMGLGIDLAPGSPEREILNLENGLVRGKLPAKKNEILISEEFAGKLGVKIGETATLLSSTMYGSMAMHNFKVSGMVRFGITALDRGAIIADIDDVRAALDMTDGASEILGFSKNMVLAQDAVKELAQQFNEQYSEENDEFSPVMMTLGDQGGLADYLKFADAFVSILVSVFVLAMGIVLWNAGLMNGLRRYGEVGLRLAMGEPKGRIYRSLIYESVVIGLIGSAIGTILGLALSYYLQYAGLDFSDMMQKSSMIMTNEIRACVTVTSYYIGFLPGIFASVLGTVFAGIGIYRRKTSQLFKELEA